VPEDFEEKPSEGLNIPYYLGVVRRRHLQFLIPLFVGWTLVWAASWVLPPRYRSTTLILVEQPTMPKDYVTPNINDDLQERMQSISQQILSRTRLLHIIDQFNLYASDHGERLPDDKVESMRKDIGDIELVRDTRTNQITSFNVGYSSRDPRLAQQVTSELTNLFINENLEVRQQQSEGTTQFLEEQLESARKSLAEQEDRIRQFKGTHVGEMPGQLASNLQILSGLQSQLQNEQDALNAAKQQHVYLQTLTDQYRTLQGTAKAADGTTTPVGLPALNQELDRLKAQLADLRSHYTDRHPDVRKVKEQITETEKMRDQLLASLKAKDTNKAADDSPNESAVASTVADPSQTSMSLQIQGQLGSNQVEITNREHAIVSLKAKIDDYQGRLNQEPIREQQLADLTRGYDQSKANYDDLLKKKNESQMATSMELLQQGERFRVIDPPSLPQKPEFPNRLKFCGIGLGVGIALGVVFAGAFEMLDHRVYDEQDLKKLLPVPVLAEIPEIASDADEKRARRRLWLGWATAAVVICTILAGSAFSYLRG
jgi:polysaccharide biosynthesis transport protein